MKIRFAFKAGTIAAFVVIRLLGTTPAASAQTPGSFATTGNMTETRVFHTATLLNNGKVLIAGGSGSGGNVSAVSSAELYDPTTGKFSPTGAMTAIREGHAAILLPDGRVLLAGGLGPICALGSCATATAELYNPATGTFSATGNMLQTGPCFAGVLLDTGKVLIVVGSDIPNPPSPDSAQIYDPDTGTFFSAGTHATTSFPIVADQFCPTATPLPNGKVLVTWNTGFAELYDAASGSFSSTGRMVANPSGDSTDPGQSTTLLASGQVLFAGGSDYYYSLDSAETYDPVSGRFRTAGKMTIAREGHSATLLSDGTVLIAGGACRYYSNVCGFYTSLSSSEIYDPSGAVFTAAGSMLEPRLWHTATLLNDGRMLIAGGFNENSGGLSSAELYVPAGFVPPPTLYSAAGAGPNQGAILHANTPLLAAPDHPANAGDLLEIYCTGVSNGDGPPPQVLIGGQMAEVLFFGDAPGWAGLDQVNVRVPSGIAPGPAVSVRMNYLGRASNEVTIAVQ